MKEVNLKLAYFREKVVEPGLFNDLDEGSVVVVSESGEVYFATSFDEFEKQHNIKPFSLTHHAWIVRREIDSET